MIQLSDEAAKELNDTLNELKVNSNTMVIKMDQIHDSMEKLEKTVEFLTQNLSTQEKRITILEQKVPQDLITDIALLKKSQESSSKVLWTMVTITMGLIVQAIYKMIVS